MPIYDEDDVIRPGHRPHPGRGRLIVLIAAILVVGLACWGIISRVHHQHVLKEDTERDAVLVVNVIHPQPLDAASDVVLPGNVHAWHEASLSSRVSGYLKAWHKDIGDHVQAGDLLAEIDTPEVDRQLQQAEADLALAVANSQLADATAKRWLALVKTDAVSKQETDEKVADAKAKAATVLSQTASRDRLREMESFKRILAPFDGIVTARTTDIGALVSEGGDPLYHVSTTDQLRIYVNVPELYSGALSDNTVAELHFTEHPGEVFKAKLLNTSGSLDPANRTLLAQFVLDNPGGKLFPGGFCEVHLKSPQTQPSMSLPVNAFLFQDAGLQIAVVGPDLKVRRQSVTPGRDFGKSIEIPSGLKPDDNVIINPADSLYDGEAVRIAPQAKADGGRQEQEAKDEKAKEPDNSKDKSGDGRQDKDHAKTKDQTQDNASPGHQDKSQADSALPPGSVPDNRAEQDENSKAPASGGTSGQSASQTGGPESSQGDNGKKKDAGKDTKLKSNDPNTRDDAK